MATKRNLSPNTSSLKDCNYGLKCYRRNPNHFETFRHPHLEQLLDLVDVDTRIAQMVQQGADESTIKEQLKIVRHSSGSQPSPKRRLSPDNSTASCEVPKPSPQGKRPKAGFLYHLTKIKDVQQTHNDGASVYLVNFLKPSKGVAIKKSLQMNFLVDFEWLWMNYEVLGLQSKPLTIIYGEHNPELERRQNVPDNVTSERVKMPMPFGTHHTKMMILEYENDSVRVIVSTANLVPSDWENRTQGVWVSPLCPKVSGIDKNSGDSLTGFKKKLLEYLNFYKLSNLQPFVKSIEKCDFSEINAFFVASVPGSHSHDSWGHLAVRNILRRHLAHNPLSSNWPVIAQCSSIGSLGPTPESWLENEFLTSLGHGSKTINLVYPSKQDVLNSLDGILGGGCLPYMRSTHEKQPWICGHMHNWRSESHHRTRAVPHIKTYTKLSPDGKSCAYVLLTSANLSKAAWGTLNKSGDKLLIKSYEAGILFLPKLTTGTNVFTLSSDECDHKFYLPYDTPLTRFSSTEVPWLMDYLHATLK